MITLTNDFHNTSVRTRLKPGKNVIPWSTYQRWMRKLCGMKDCHCAQVRGVQRLPDGTKFSVGFGFPQAGKVLCIIDLEEY